MLSNGLCAKKIYKNTIQKMTFLWIFYNLLRTNDFTSLLN